MCKQIFDGSGYTHPAITTAAPTGAVGIDFSTAGVYHTSRWRKYALEIASTGGPSDCTLWVMRGTADVWSKFQDMFGVIKLGKVATALPDGTYTFVVPDLGSYARVYIQNSAGTMTAVLLPIQEM